MIALQGALLANFPWDGNEDGQATYAACPDDAAFRHLASTYARAHRKMHTSKEFPGGITNGAAWYPVWGGMQVQMHPSLEFLCIRKLRLPTQRWWQGSAAGSIAGLRQPATRTL